MIFCKKEIIQLIGVVTESIEHTSTNNLFDCQRTATVTVINFKQTNFPSKYFSFSLFSIYFTNDLTFFYYLQSDLQFDP